MKTDHSNGVMGIKWFAAAFILLTLATVQSALAQQTVTFTDSVIENNFPNGLTFKITAESSAGEITSAKLYYSLLNDTSTTQQLIHIEPAAEVDLVYSWDTSRITVPPSAPVVYSWEVVDSAGNRVKSEEKIFRYDDINFDWQVLESDDVAVWWHDRSKEFGERVFDIAERAFNEQQQLFQSELQEQIRILIYNDFDEFASWHSFVSEFVGGQAFPSLGLTIQIVTPSASEDIWLNEVIPHEISHLYLFQATQHPLSGVPAWLNEGLAQYNEFDLDQAALEFAAKAVREKRLLPLWSLSGSFGYDEDEVRLAYAESLSAVLYMVEDYGNDGVAALLAAHKYGLSGDEALLEGLGVTLFEFQTGWLDWLGVDPAMYPMPSPIPTIAWPTAPAMYPEATAVASETPMPDSTAPTRKPAAATDTVQATAVSAISVTATRDSSNDEDVFGQARSKSTSRQLLCGAAMLPLAVVSLLSRKHGSSKAD